MPANTPLGFTYPLGTDPPAAHTQMQELATDLDTYLDNLNGGMRLQIVKTQASTDPYGNFVVSSPAGTTLRAVLAMGAQRDAPLYFVYNEVDTPSAGGPDRCYLTAFRHDGTKPANTIVAFIVLIAYEMP